MPKGVTRVGPMGSTIPNKGSIRLYDEYNNITSEILNKLLANQQVSITLLELDRLKDIPGVKFDLPLNDHTYPPSLPLFIPPSPPLRIPAPPLRIPPKGGD